MSDKQITVSEINPTVNVEYWYDITYLQATSTFGSQPPVNFWGFPIGYSRSCSFEVVVNDKLIYSKLQTMALPDYEEVAQVVNDVSKGSEPKHIKGQQPINCTIS